MPRAWRQSETLTLRTLRFTFRGAASVATTGTGLNGALFRVRVGKARNLRNSHGWVTIPGVTADVRGAGLARE